MPDIRTSDFGGIPFGNTAGRPTPATGKLYSNGQTARLELYTSAGAWENIVQEVPGVSGISGNYSESTNSGTIVITGTNFVSGAIASAIGTNAVEVQASSTTYNSLVQLTAVFTGLSNANEPYDIKVTNPSNLFGLLPDALYVNASPVWVTSAGSLGSFTEQVAISVSATATDSDSTIAYALAAGSTLPSGVTLNSSTGLISGTLPDIASNTAYTFTINASDGLNVIPRAFSITSNVLANISTAETLVVAGGGGGGSNGNTTGGGGGGAGGYIYNASTSFTPGTVYALSVGVGGVGRQQSNSSPSSGSKGTNSAISGSGFTTITAFGGGGGASNQSGGKLSDVDGGSGGGGNYSTIAGTGVSPQGNPGGAAQQSASHGGGGGGGSSTSGNQATNSGGNGGNGTANSITGTSLNYAAGGGGGVRTGYPAGTGGSSIGGDGAVGVGNGSNASPASRGSGGGGGGGDNNNPQYIGGTGSDGVIIISYPNSVIVPTISGALTYDQPTRAGYRVYRFTAGTGTITF